LFGDSYRGWGVVGLLGNWRSDRARERFNECAQKDGRIRCGAVES